MKKILSIVILCAALFGAATASAETRWGVTAGADITTLQFNQDLFKVDQAVGYSAGLVGELMIPGIGFGVDASLLYTQRGATLHLGDQKVWASEGYGNERCYLHYIEIPINLKFKYTNLNGIENTIAPIAFAGPDFSFLVGHNKLDALSYAAGEFGVHVGLGAELFRKFQITGSYGWGMAYAVKTKKLDDFSAKNKGWKIMLTYMF